VWKVHINGVIQYMVLWDWLWDCSQSIMGSMLQHVSALYAFLCPDNIPPHGYTLFHVPIHQLMDTWVVCDVTSLTPFASRAVLNNT
jgi:hypothetical protein